VRRDVCGSDELRPGQLLGVRIGPREIVVVRTGGGELHAVSGRCLHQGASLAGGRLLADVDGERPGEYRLVEGREVIKCPWHGYEYDLENGCALFDPRRRLRTFDVSERDGRVVIEFADAPAPATAEVGA
jgi:nitrite reductase (NADH) small subunit